MRRSCSVVTHREVSWHEKTRCRMGLSIRLVVADTERISSSLRPWSVRLTCTLMRGRSVLSLPRKAQNTRCAMQHRTTATAIYLVYTSLLWRLRFSFSAASFSAIVSSGSVSVRAFVPTSSRLRTLTDLLSSSSWPTTRGVHAVSSLRQCRLTETHQG